MTSYTGYDGYQQQLTYDANGMRLSKDTYGNSNRSTLEELLRGDIAGLPEVILPGTQENASGNEYEWATEEYLYDITQEYYQVIAKTEKTANEEKITAYAYGLERIAAYEPNQRTKYVYDGRGSVAKTVSTLKAGDTKEQNFIYYTAFGEQMGTQKVSGFGYNAEAYDAATGMINLRARQYEAVIGKFMQEDLVIGYILNPISLNPYLYVTNSPITFVDPSGMKMVNIVVEMGVTQRNISNESMTEKEIVDFLKQQKVGALQSGVSKIDATSTRNSYEYYIKSNYSKNNTLRAAVDRIRKEAKLKKLAQAPKKTEDIQCATYVSNGHYSKKIGIKTIIYSYLSRISKRKNEATSYTSPQYAALTGEYSRDQYDYYTEDNKRYYTTIKKGEKPYNEGYLSPCVLMAVSIHEGEGIRVKTPESQEYRQIEATEDYTLMEQLQIVLKANILQENDIVFFVADEGTNNKSGVYEIYIPEIGQVHVGVMSTKDTYSASNSYVFRRQLNDAVGDYEGMDFILLNSDTETIEMLRQLYGGNE